MPAVMPYNQNPYCFADDPKQEMVRKSLQIDAPDIALSNGERFRPLGCLNHDAPQLDIEIVRQLGSGGGLVILHDLVDVRVNLRMKNKPHQLRRL